MTKDRHTAGNELRGKNERETNSENAVAQCAAKGERRPQKALLLIAITIISWPFRTL